MNNQDFHVIIPAAGCSRRMAHLTTAQPKSLLLVEGKTIIERSLAILNARGLRQVTFIVGYMRELLMQSLGERYKNIAIDYVVSPDYDTTEHGWSLFLARDRWAQTQRDVIFMDADNLYHPALLDQVLAAPFDNVILVDNRMASQREEEIVFGSERLVHSLRRGHCYAEPGYVGGFVGINRFSSQFMSQLFSFMAPFFENNGREYKYERVFDAFIHATNARLHYATTEQIPWLNVNREQDISTARELVHQLDQVTAVAVAATDC